MLPDPSTVSTRCLQLYVSHKPLSVPACKPSGTQRGSYAQNMAIDRCGLQDQRDRDGCGRWSSRRAMPHGGQWEGICTGWLSCAAAALFQQKRLQQRVAEPLRRRPKRVAQRPARLGLRRQRLDPGRSHAAACWHLLTSRSSRKLVCRHRLWKDRESRRR